MKETSRTKAELLAEIASLKQKNKQLRLAAAKRKKAEQELLVSEEKYRKIFEGATAGIYQTTPGGRFLCMNPAFSSMFGYSSPQEMIDSITDIGRQIYVRPQEREDMARLLLQQDKATSYEAEVYRKDKSRFWMSVNIHAVRDAAGNVLYFEGTNLDITERKRAEESLQENEERYRNVFENHVAVKLLIDPANGRIIKANKAAANYYGWSQEQLEQMSIQDINTLSFEDIFREMQKARANNRISFEFKHRRADGSIRDVEVFSGNIKVEGKDILHSIIHDVTSRKKAEEALRESEERYRNFVENSFAGVYVVQDHRFVFLNENASSFAGYETAELVGTYPEDVIHPEDREKSRKNARKMLRGEDTSPYEFRVIARDGQIHWIMEMVSYIQYNGRRAILGNSMDITERKQAEEALRTHQDLETSILLSVPYGLFGVEKRRIFFVNDAMEKVFGWKREELIGKSTRILFRNDEEWEQYGAMLYSWLKKMPVATFDCSIPFVRKDGQEMLCRNSVSRIGEKLGETNRIVATFEDITERKKAEEALSQSEAMLSSVFNATPAGLCVMKNRVFQSANRAYYENLGYSEAEIIGRTPRMMYENDEEYERAGRELYAGLSGNCLPSVQTRHLRKDGSVRDVVLTAVPLQANDDSVVMQLVTVEDVTDRKRIEEELKENRKQLANIIEFLPDATLVIDREGKVVAWNRAIEAMTGVEKKNMLGKGNHEYALPFYGDRRDILIDLALKADAEMEKKYTSIQRSGDILMGEAFTPNLPCGTLHLSGTASVLRDNRGEVYAAIECIRDNTERKKLEERLQRAEKMEALGQLAGGVAHDLNNVLGILSGYSELLLMEIPEGQRSRRHAERILQSTEKGAAIIQDLLTLARRGVTAAEVINLNSIVTGFLKSPVFEKMRDFHPRVNFDTYCQEGLLNIKGSPVHLEKTLMNLVANAAESIIGGGTVTIRTENRYLDKPIRSYDEVQEGDYTILTIADTGMGIPEENREKIFEPFYTKKTMGRSGTGLGLAIVWGTVKDHNGYIDVQTEVGKGTIFTLYFPVTREALSVPQEKVPMEELMGNGELVLVVDDIAEQREVASGLLKELGYRVEAVASGEAAVEYLRENRADILVLDMIMAPGIDGLETYQRIIKIKPQQKAILVSGFSETNRVREAQQLGAGAYVKKPYMVEKIGLAIRDELRR